MFPSLLSKGKWEGTTSVMQSFIYGCRPIRTLCTIGRSTGDSRHNLLNLQMKTSDKDFDESASFSITIPPSSVDPTLHRRPTLFTYPTSSFQTPEVRSHEPPKSNYYTYMSGEVTSHQTRQKASLARFPPLLSPSSQELKEKRADILYSSYKHNIEARYRQQRFLSFFFPRRRLNNGRMHPMAQKCRHRTGVNAQNTSRVHGGYDVVFRGWDG